MPEREFNLETLEETSVDNPYVSKFEEFFGSVYKKQVELLVGQYPQKRSLNVDFKQLERFDIELADALLDHPDLLLEACHYAVEKIDVPALEITEFKPHVRFYNLPSDREPLVRDIGAEHLAKLIAVEGIIRQITEVLPKLKIALWQCRRCGNTYKIAQEKPELKMPDFCECRHRDFVLVADKSVFINYQKIQIQESLEKLKGNQQASYLDIYVSDDLVNRVNAGDKIKFCGILKLSSTPQNKTVYGRFLEASHIEETEKEFSEVDVLPEEEKEIKKLAADPQIYDKLIQSIAPAIYGHETVKESIVMQLFGGVRKTLPGDAHVRGNIHVLLVGDPGLAKCVSGETELFMPDGSVEKIENIVEGNLHNPIPFEDGFYSNLEKPIELPILNSDCCLVAGKAIRVFKRKPDKMFEITTQHGKVLKSTHTHPLFVSRNGKVTALKVEDLKQGDFIATPRKLEFGKILKVSLEKIEHAKTNAVHIKYPDYLERELAIWLGFMAAEGYTKTAKTTKHIRFTNCDNEVLEKFTQSSRQLFGVKAYSRERKGSTEIICDSTELGNFLEKNFPEILKKSGERSVPEKIFQSPNPIAKEFLKAFIEGEGHVRKDSRQIEICSKSKKLIEGIENLLLRQGIVCFKKKIRNIATNGKMAEKQVYWKISISGHFALKYLEEIGFFTERKNSELKNWKKTLGNTNVDVIPNIGTEIKRIRKILGLSQFECGIPRTTLQHFDRGDRNPSRGTLYQISAHFMEKFHEKGIENIQLEHDIANLMKFSISEIFWDKIVKKNEIQAENWVYDLEVEGTHNFISNGIFSHNSQLLQAAHNIAPKSIYVAGKTTSGVGLTATAVKDEFGEGGWTLKAGALVLASGGICMTDELDKMAADERSALHEAMEQGMISVAKAGIVTRFKADTSILAAANPKFSRFDPYQPFIQQVDLPSTLISRFDLFFMIKDVLDRTKDEQIAAHILKTHQVGEMMSQQKRKGTNINKKEIDEMKKTVTPKILPELLRKYISYARQNVFPTLTSDSIKLISDFYVGLRDMGRKEGSYSATHRQLEGLVRLSEASARIRLSDVVEIEDAERAIRLVRSSLEDVVTDPETGKIDYDIIVSGQTHTKLNNLKKVLSIIKSKAQEMEMVPIEDVILEAAKEKIDEEKVKDILAELEKKGEIYKPRYHFVKPSQKSS